jgi:hypothetical protein
MAVVAAVWALGLTGAVVGVAALTGDDARDRAAAPAAAPAEAPARGQYGLGDRIRTSFGVASVGSVVTVTGPRYAMGLKTRPDDRVFQIQLAMVNRGRRSVVVDPDLVTLTPSRALGDVAIATGSARGGRIAALSAHNYAIRFAIASGAPLPRLRLRDPATGRISAVALGSTSGTGTLDLSKHHPTPGGGR